MYSRRRHLLAQTFHSAFVTGKFAGIQGMLRAFANFDTKTGFIEAQTEIEYSMGK
jgi:hypothetical protein